jgi:hypothetical protein
VSAFQPRRLPAEDASNTPKCVTVPQEAEAVGKVTVPELAIAPLGDGAPKVTATRA